MTYDDLMNNYRNVEDFIFNMCEDIDEREHLLASLDVVRDGDFENSP